MQALSFQLQNSVLRGVLKRLHYPLEVMHHYQMDPTALLPFLRQVARGEVEPLLSGLLFGAICTVGMLKPLQLAPGVIIDEASTLTCLWRLPAWRVSGTSTPTIVSSASAKPDSRQPP